MKDTRKPSMAMIEKLMNAQGIKGKITDFIRQSIIRFALPLMPPSDTNEEEIKKILNQLDDRVVLKAFTQVYSKHFNANEIMDLIAFYKSPTGQKLSKVQDNVALDIVIVAQKIISNAILGVVREGLKDNLEKLKDLEIDDLDFSEFEDLDKFEELH